MKSFLLILFINGLILPGQGIPGDDNKSAEKYRQEIIDADIAFSKMSLKKEWQKHFCFMLQRM